MGSMIFHDCQVMDKSNFQILNDAEVELAHAGQYLVNMPIAVDKNKVLQRNKGFNNGWNVCFIITLEHLNLYCGTFL